MFAGFKSRWVMPWACGFLQRLRDFRADFQDLIERQRAFAEAIGERLALEIFHDQEVHAVLRADVVQRADVGMIQRRNRAGLALHALFQFGVGGKMIGENLDGDVASEAGVAGAVHLAHSTRTEGRLNFVGAELAARGQGHESGHYTRRAAGSGMAPDVLDSYAADGRGGRRHMGRGDFRWAQKKGVHR